MCTIRIPFSRGQLDSFVSGWLREEWADRYPLIFDSKDLIEAERNPFERFYEWLAIVALHETYGFTGKLQKESDSYDSVKSFIPKNVFETVELSTRAVPKIYLHNPDSNDWKIAAPMNEEEKTVFQIYDSLRKIEQKICREIPIISIYAKDI